MPTPCTDKRITINISGSRYETFESTLHRFPTTLLGNPEKRKLFFCSRNNEYFFDRHRACFGAILYFYQSRGTLNCPPGVLIQNFESECFYFAIPRADIVRMMRAEGILFDITTMPDAEKQKHQLSVRARVWNFLEKPHSSYEAWLFGIFSLLMAMLVVFIVAAKTTPGRYLQSRLSNVVFAINIWFLVELTIRFMFSPCKVVFLRDPMTWIDILAVAPHFILGQILGIDTKWLVVINTIKLVKIIRLFPFSKQSCPLKVVGIILRLNVRRLQLLFICLTLSIYLGGHLVFLAERHIPDTKFTSVPQSLWYSVQTITSVGYGDLVPSSLIGRLFACCFMVVGILTYIPLLSIVSQFITVYPRNVGYGRHIGTVRKWTAF